MTSDMTPIEAIASVYLTGAHLCIRDDGELGMLATQEQADSIIAAGGLDALGVHHDEIRATVLEGIHQVLDGYQPALDGLARYELQDESTA